jgi:hypothetical protein
MALARRLLYLMLSCFREVLMMVAIPRALLCCVLHGFILLAGFWASESLAVPVISGQVIRGAGLAHVLTCHNRARTPARARLILRGQEGEASAHYRLRLGPRQTSHVALSHTDQRLSEFRVIPRRSKGRRPVVCQHCVHLLAARGRGPQSLPLLLPRTTLRGLGIDDHSGLPRESAPHSSTDHDRAPSDISTPTPCE